MVLTAWLVCCLPQLGFDPNDPQLDAHVTLRVNGTPVPRLVKEIQGVTTVPLSADGALKGQVLVVDVTDVRVGDLMARIAEVADCAWKPDGPGFKLVDSPERKAATEALDRAERLSAIVRAQQQAQTIANEAYSAGTVANYLRDQWALSQSRRRRSDQFDSGPLHDPYSALPAGRSLSRALTAVDPAEIASLSPGQRLVYSSKPTKVQRPLRIDPAEEARREAEESRTLKEALLLLLPKEREQLPSLGQSMFAELPQGGTRVRFVVTRERDLEDQIVAEWQLADKGGATLVTASTVLWASPATRLLGADWVDKPDADRHVPASDDAVTQRNLLFTNTWTEPSPEQTAQIKRLFFRPDLLEPLSYYTSDVLCALARTKGLDLVAELSDLSIVAGFVKGADGSDLPGLEERLALTVFTPAASRSGWMLWRPREALVERQGVDRGALAWAISSPKGLRELSLEDLATYSFRKGGAPGLDIVELLYLSASGKSSVFENYMVRDPALVFLGSLDTATRRALYTGKRLPYSQFSGVPKTLLQETAFDAGSPGRLLRADGTSAEPTEACPDGIPPSAFVELTHEDTPLLYTKDEKDGTWTANSVEWVAGQVAASRRPRRPGDDPVVVPSRFRLGATRAYVLNLWVSGDTRFTYSAHESVEASGTEYTWATLPRHLREQLADEVRRLLSGGAPKEVPESDGGREGL